MNIKLLNARVAWGHAAIDALGYRCRETQDSIIVLGVPRWIAAISAHAPSECLVEIDQPVAIAGATNASFNCPRPVDAFVNDHHIGTLTRSSELTPRVHIPPGIVTLRFEGLSHIAAHTVWLIYPSPYPAFGRLALVTVGAYTRDAIKNKLRYLFRSAALRGILVHVACIGEQYQSHYENKVVRLKRFVEALPSAYGIVAYLDGVDGFVLGTEEEIIDTFLDFNSPGVCGTEDCCWPVRDDRFRNMFTQGTHRFLNAGTWIGSREWVQRSLAELQSMHFELKTGAWPSYASGRRRRAIFNDQLLWQIAYLENRITLRLDTEWHLFDNLPCTWMFPTPNAHFDIVEGRLRVPDGHRPPLIHLPGAGKRNKHLWWGLIEAPVSNVDADLHDHRA